MYLTCSGSRSNRLEDLQVTVTIALPLWCQGVPAGRNIRKTHDKVYCDRVEMLEGRLDRCVITNALLVVLTNGTALMTRGEVLLKQVAHPRFVFVCVYRTRGEAISGMG